MMTLHHGRTTISLWCNRFQHAMHRRKTLSQILKSQQDDGDSKPSFRRTLGAFDLVLYGVGSSVGAGIYVLVGLGAKMAGPAVALSFLGCGLSCILTSLAYAEFAARFPVTGSAFTYAYVAFGEVVAWMLGWNLTLGYGFTTSVVARAWGDYVGDFLLRAAANQPIWLRNFIANLTEFPLFGEGVDYICSPLSIVIVWLNTLILLRGVQDSSRFGNMMTILNISVLVAVVLTGLTSRTVEMDNLTPFMPHHVSGVVAGAGLVFFAFIGFDMVASLSEEVVRPERNMPIGIVGSLVISTLIYVSVSLVVVGMAPIDLLGETVPVINALLANACCTHEQQMEAAIMRSSHHVCLHDCEQSGNYLRPILAATGHWVSIGAIFGLMVSCFTSLMGQPRIFYSLARDGLIPSLFAELHPETHVPHKGIVVTGVACALLACFAPMAALANLISLGTLMVFTFVNAGVLLLRLRDVPQQQEQQEQQQHEDAVFVGIPQQQQQNRRSSMVVLLLVAYTASVLLLSMLVGHCSNYSRTAVTALGAVALACAVWISKLPSAWTCENTDSPTASASASSDDSEREVDDVDTWRQDHHQHQQPNTATTPIASFQCPWVPWIPLAGMAANLYMMGSLPLSSWWLVLIWIVIGLMLYLGYGMHHSVLANADITNPKLLHRCDTTPLLPGEETMLTNRGYESTLNVSLRDVSPLM